MSMHPAGRVLAGLALVGLFAATATVAAQERTVIDARTSPERNCRGSCVRRNGDRARSPGLLPSLDLRNRKDAYTGGYRDGFRDGLRAGIRGGRFGPRRRFGGGAPAIHPDRFTWVDGVPFLDVPPGAEFFEGPHFQYGGARSGRGARCNRSGGHFHGKGGELIVRWR